MKGGLPAAQNSVTRRPPAHTNLPCLWIAREPILIICLFCTSFRDRTRNLKKVLSVFKFYNSDIMSQSRFSERALLLLTY